MDKPIGKAKNVMQFFQKIAKICTDNKLPIQWTSPSGMVCHQAYKENKSCRVELLLNGSFFVKPRINVELDSLSRRQQVNGISPNVIHSLDASVLHKTVNLAKKCGVENFLMIHDSYGCHIADIDVMLASAKRTMIDMFSTDRLYDFLAQIKTYLPDATGWPEIPQKGKLKLDTLMDSNYMFC
jgi:DNA-directed RNA polymerase